MPEHLLESELFGHVRGAFTGAVADRVGRFELAHQGTLFLDEIGDLPLPLQVKLLRVLQQREFERLGSAKPVKLDIRVLAATNRNLPALVSAGGFREDLYYRLNVVPIEMPPLRTHVEDIPLIAESFLDRLAKRSESRLKHVTPNALKHLMDYHWPGNVRELENALEYAVVTGEDDWIRTQDLPQHLAVAGRAAREPRRPRRAGSVDDVEQQRPGARSAAAARHDRILHSHGTIPLHGVGRRRVWRGIVRSPGRSQRNT